MIVEILGVIVVFKIIGYVGLGGFLGYLKSISHRDILFFNTNRSLKDDLRII